MFNKRFFSKGMEDGGLGLEEEEYADAIFNILTNVFSFCISDVLPFLRGFDLDGYTKVMKENYRITNKHHDPIIDRRIQQWKDGTKKEMEDLLDVLINLKDDNDNPLLTKDEIKGQIVEIALPIVDNPSNAYESAFIEMLNQPEIFDKAIEELNKVVGTWKRETSLRIGLCAAQLREAMR
ncbi:unnamed protein product [Dovyalis caffra]|uniref:Uncharacterized protein n=1 Tax=Dovyalis caffra TaxID=77055 RepID=A0AAV1RW46_9ROSI|nr:unnamed protein product [Dovyalis caffra]